MMVNPALSYIYDIEPVENGVDDVWSSTAKQIVVAQPSVHRDETSKWLAFNTLMSEKQLNARGLALHSHQADNWLIDIDADTLIGTRPCSEWKTALERRLGQLRDLAIEEELPFSQASADHALKFAMSMSRATVRPSAFLIGNGNIRLLWARNREQIGLQFHEDGQVQFVLFVDRGERVATLMGDDGPDDILRHITSAGLRHLLND